MLPLSPLSDPVLLDPVLLDPVLLDAHSTDRVDVAEFSPVPVTGWRARLGGFRVRPMLDRAVAFFYPPQCSACEAVTQTPHSLCVRCWNALPLISRPYCERLGTPFAVDFGAGMLSPAAIADPPRFDRGRAVARHQGSAQDLVSRLKYGERLDLARLMARMMVQAGAELLGDADLIVPVPMHPLRLWRRRYNQAALLANEVSVLTGVPVDLEALQRIRHTPAQVGLGRSERQKNVSGAFRIAPAHEIRVAGRRVIVIDDVRTTGSTANACAHILRKAGAARIDILTFTVVAGGET